MPTKAIPYVKVLVHLFCLAPAVWSYHWYSSGQLALAADPVNDLTHFTGNWALWILLASLAVTPLRRAHPSLSNLIRFRRMLGLYAFFYATLHLSTYVFLYSGYDVVTALGGLRAGHPGEIVAQWKVVWPRMVDDVLKRKFIQVGLFSWVILLALAVTSPNFMLRSMGGKNWQRLHRLVYLAAIAGCIHYWWIVKSGVRAPWPDTLILTGLLLARLVWMWMKRKRQPVVKTAAVGSAG
jgi:sulfoxide reductase heme-binding subunit YedZ